MFYAVIFDWDGTLADSKAVVIDSFQKVFREANLDVSNEFIEKRIGIGSRNVILDVLKASNAPSDDRVVNKLLKKKIDAEIELASEVRLFDGAIELLDALRGKLKIALASMNDKAVINRLLREKGIREYFDVVVAAEDVVTAKPEPEIFLKAAVKLNCGPEECVVLEDSVFGVRAARAAKMKCIAVPSGSYSATELGEEKPDLTAGSLKEKHRIMVFILGGDCSRASPQSAKSKRSESSLRHAPCLPSAREKKSRNGARLNSE